MAVVPVPAAVPSPQFHERDAMVPSASVEAVLFTDTVIPLMVAVNDACGA